MNWKAFNNILIVRADNIGDLVMSSPAIRAVKDYTGARITLLASSACVSVSAMLPFIDDVIVAELPWAKRDDAFDREALSLTLEVLKKRRFDAAILFTVYSQSPLPSAMLCWMAGIPVRLAYCRENPYELINQWVPDREPYHEIRHQVERDIELIRSAGIPCHDNRIRLHTDTGTETRLNSRLQEMGICLHKPFLVFHAAVSEKKRQFPNEKWAELIKETVKCFNYPVYFTGSANDRELNEELVRLSDRRAMDLSGIFSLAELAVFIRHTVLLVSVNTGVVHIASGVNTPVVVLYARTNPQHTPWKVSNRVLEYSIDEKYQSRNEVIRYVNEVRYSQPIGYPKTEDIIQAMKSVIRQPVVYPGYH